MRTVQIPEDVYDQASILAAQDHVSVDRVIAALVREGVGEWTRLHHRAANGSLVKLQSVLSKVRDMPPDAADSL